MKFTILPAVFFTFFCFGISNAAYPQPCESNIYCYGELLETVQLAGIYPDSKTFVDMKLKNKPELVLKNFEAFKKRYPAKSPPKGEIVKFLDDNFDKEGSEFATWDPLDWHDNPKFLQNITDVKLRNWAEKLHSYWKQLGRKIKEDVKLHPELYSMIYVSNPVIVPGGRFREFFYWDSYWIMEGLLLSEMHDTVKGMLLNFIEMVDTLGYVPNGGRIYFRRSQPPLLIPMVKLYLDKTNDKKFVIDNLPFLVKEFEFWLNNRTLNVQHKGKQYKMARYNVEMTGPRPESFREDYELAEKLSTEEEKDELYINLKSGAESGWDFSSRWFIPPTNTLKGNLSHTKVRDIIPVELNALIHLNAKYLAEFHELANLTSKVPEYENIANEWKTTLNDVMWDEELGSWFDYDHKRNELRKEFYPSNIIPLWANAQASDKTVTRIINYMKNVKALTYPGGVPTSLTQAGEQWDFPNGWAPLQHWIVDSLERSQDAEAKELAFELATKWISTNYLAFVQTTPNHMFEKYDVTVHGAPGGGGEYSVVVGFGWTNGVVLDFLNRYGDRMKAPTQPKANSATALSSTIFSTTVTLGGITLLIASLFGLTEAGRRIRDGRCKGSSLCPTSCGDYSLLKQDEDDACSAPSPSPPLNTLYVSEVEMTQHCQCPQ